MPFGVKFLKIYRNYGFLCVIYIRILKDFIVSPNMIKSDKLKIKLKILVIFRNGKDNRFKE